MKKTAILLLSMTMSSALACSNIFVTSDKASIVARTMDFPFNTGDTIGLGLKGQKNETYLNMQAPALQSKALVWTNKYDFVGQAFLTGNLIDDGVNDAGLYAGELYLPDFTQYPAYNKNDQRPLLSAQNTTNYLLGMADNVTDAIKLLKQVQIVKSASYVGIKGEPGTYIVAPVHLVLRDRSGHSAVVEWINGKTVIHDHAGQVLTNAPTYNWQVNNAQRYDYVTDKNINAKFDGAYMNGSGFLGMPGDYTPPNRFARATQIIKHMPTPQNHDEAIRLAMSAIESIQVPIGASDSPSLWKSVGDLNTSTYYFDTMYIVDPEYAVIGGPGVKVHSPNLTKSWRSYPVAHIAMLAREHKLPKGMELIRNGVPAKGTLRKIVDLTSMPTSGPRTTTKAKYPITSLTQALAAAPDVRSKSQKNN